MHLLRTRKSMSLETIESLAWWFGVATVFFTILTGLAGWGAFHFASKSSERKDAKNAKLSTVVQSMQHPVAFTAQATLKVKNSDRIDPARPAGIDHALLHVGNSNGLNERPGGHLFFLLCDNIKDWRSEGEEESSYDLVFQDGRKTQRANDLTVDELLRESDAAIVTAFFLRPDKMYEVLGGQITVTVNATNTKHFSISPQKVEPWLGIYATAD